jgi:hypothetical protein
MIMSGTLELCGALSRRHQPQHSPADVLIQQLFVRVMVCTGPAPFETGMLSAERLAQGTVILSVSGPVSHFPSAPSIQVGPSAHLEASVLALLQHSCAPTCAVEPFHREGLYGLVVRAIREIVPGEAFSFNCLTTEYELAYPFECYCGEFGCFGQISGWRHLTIEQRHQLLPLLAPHLRERAVNE